MKRKLNLLLWMPILVGLTIAPQGSMGQQGASNTPGLVDSAPLIVVQVIPANASPNIEPETTIAVTFNQAINSTSVTEQSFVVNGSISGPHTGTFESNGSVVQFEPTQNFSPGEEVIVSLTQSILAQDGTPLSPYVWSFYTAVGGGSGFFVNKGENFKGDNGTTALGDLDNDGDLDTFFVTQEQSKIFLNDGAGHFSASGQTLKNAWGWRVVLGDLDHDGDLDAYVVNHAVGHTVWMNDGHGFFTDSGQVLGQGHTYQVALGDVDRDGDLDVLAANYNGNALWLNNGAGLFTQSIQNLGEYGIGVALGDIDNDGDLDAFFVNDIYNTEGYPATIWLNNGDGLFSDSGQRLGLSEGAAVALGDFDQDGDLDAFVANENYHPDKVWLNNGSGLFTDSGQNLGTTYSLDVALGDLDDDGDLDAFVAVGHAEGSEPQSNKIWLNNGSGVFTESGQNFGVGFCEDIALGDLDQDQDIDVVFAHRDEQPNQVWMNSDQIYRVLLPSVSR